MSITDEREQGMSFVRRKLMVQGLVLRVARRHVGRFAFLPIKYRFNITARDLIQHNTDKRERRIKAFDRMMADAAQRISLQVEHGSRLSPMFNSLVEMEVG